MARLVWFRSDLRVADNTALLHACRDAVEPVVALFTYCPAQWNEHDWGRPKVDFVQRNLVELSQRLAELNIPLKFIQCPNFSEVPSALVEFALESKCTSLYFNDEYEINEQRRDRAVEQECAGHGIAVHRFLDQVIMAPGSVKTQQEGWYSVFTPFRKRWTELLMSRHDYHPQSTPKPQQESTLAADPVPDMLADFEWGTEREDLWPAGEAEAAKRLESFSAARIELYNERRDVPSVNGTSTLSPYLAAGVLSPRQALQRAMRANDGHVVHPGNPSSGASVWISELIWREFYKHLLVGFPRLSMHRPFRLETERLEWSRDEAQFEAWCKGETGFPIVDAAMRQLAQTGWMHNRLRMVSAMFLTKDLNLDWQWGERHFMRNLVDGDLAANNGGWQWSASTGTDAAPYFRIFNPTSQGQRFDAQGTFIRKFVPELSELTGRSIHEPSKLGSEKVAEMGYFMPICDHKQARLDSIAAFKALKS